MGLNYKILLFTLLLISLIGSVNAQTPVPMGSNINLELWLSADKLLGNSALPADGTPINTWNDLSTSGLNFIKNGSDLVPGFTYNGINYNPAVEFLNDDELTLTNNRARKLISSANFSISSSKSYYVFYVSEVSDEIDTYAAVLNLNANDESYGWQNTGALWYELRANNRTHLSIGNTNGIGSVIIPNSSSVQSRLYFNADLNSHAARTMTTTSPTKAVLGKSNTSTGDYFYGKILEIIVFSEASGNVMSDDDINRVHSYFAIKYGQTISTDYIISDFTPVWKFSQNVGYDKNIFGIGRDDDAGINVRQSASVNYPSVTAFKGSLADLNKNNTATIDNKKFVMFGANGAEDKTSYRYEINDVFDNGQLNSEITHRTNYILKTQLTGYLQYTLDFKAPCRYVLVSNNASFTPSNTRIYATDESGIAHNVLVNNGDFISFATYEYAPGGVINGLRLWLRADDQTSVETDGLGNVNIWKDQTSNQNDYYFSYVNNSGKVRPTYVECENRMNYYPSVNFTRYANLATPKGGPMSKNAPDNFTSFVVYNSTDLVGSTERLYTHGFGGVRPESSDSRYPAMGFAPNPKNAGRVRVGGTYYNGNLAGRVPNATSLQMIHTHKYKSAGDKGYITYDFGGWQETLNITSTSFGGNFKMGDGGTLGGASYYNAQFIGLISEVFFYEAKLDMDEQDKIRTYLGMKYGITIDKNQLSLAPGQNFDYKLSDGTIVWKGDSDPNSPYHNNIAGLVHDKVSNIFNNIAKSSGVNSAITMRIDGHNINCQGATPILPDKSGLFWGDNNVPVNQVVDISSDPSVCGVMNNKIVRKWLAQKTNINEVKATIRVSQAQNFPYGGPGYEIFMLVADNPTKLDNNQWDMIIPLNFVDGEHEGSYTFKNEYTYFTFGVKELPFFCEPCSFKGIRGFSFTNANYPRGTKNTPVTINMGDFSSKVSVNLESGAAMFTNYPRASSLGSLRQYRRGDISKKITTVLETSHEKPSAPMFEIFGIDKRFSRIDNIEIYGLCGGGKVYPKLYHKNSSIRTYTITGNKATGKDAGSNYSSYTNSRGRMLVDFDQTVESVHVIHTVTGRQGNGSQIIGIGPVQYVCPQPLPEPDENGLIFTKQGPPEVYLCEEVIYKFSIVNTNCLAVPVNFSDILPEGMKWISLSLSPEAENSATMNQFEQTRNLQINNLIIPKASTLSFMASAIFEMDATAKDYYNRASINYDGPITGNNSTLQSCDKLTPGCEPTKTTAKSSGARPLPIELYDFRTDLSCYSAEQEVTVSFKVKNPNAFDISDIFVDLAYNEEFSYIAGSLSYPSQFGSGTVNTSDNGVISIEDVKIPGGNTEYTISYKIKAPNQAGLIQIGVDADSKPIYAPLELAVGISSETNDICLGNTLLDANGYLGIPFCIIKPKNDYFAVFKNDIILKGDISWNDPDPNRLLTYDIITKINNAQNVIANSAPDLGTVKYITQNNFLGLDSVEYKMKIIADNKLSDSAKIYVAVVETRDYNACANEEIFVGMLPKEHEKIKYDWFKTADKDDFIGSGDSIKVKMATSDTIYWVRVRINNDTVTTPRLPVHVNFVMTPLTPDIRAQVCPYPDRSIFLSSYIDLTTNNSIKWDKLTSVSPNLININTGEINTGNFSINDVFIYKYQLENKCGVDEGKMYITIINDLIGKLPDTIVICRQTKAAEHIALNQILGLDANGTWKYDNSVNPDNTVTNNTTEIQPPSDYAGALIFNGTKAWNEASNPLYTISGFQGDPSAKMFKFIYIPSPSSCLTDISPKEIVLILTSNI